MTRDEIQKEWDAFIQYPDGSGKLYATTKSALIFAETIAKMAATAEREACAADCDAAAARLQACPSSPENRAAISALKHRAAAIRARGSE